MLANNWLACRVIISVSFQMTITCMYVKYANCSPLQECENIFYTLKYLLFVELSLLKCLSSMFSLLASAMAIFEISLAWLVSPFSLVPLEGFSLPEGELY